MAKITSNKLRDFETQADTNTVAVAAGVHIFQGMLIGLNGGYARPFQAGDKIVGFAKDEIDNRNGQNGDKQVNVKARGKVCLEIASLEQTSIGSDVVATDDDTFALGSDGDYFGKVLRLEDATHAIVAFDFLYNKENTAEEDWLVRAWTARLARARSLSCRLSSLLPCPRRGLSTRRT